MINTATSKTPIIVDENVDIIDGRIIADGAVLPYSVIRLNTVSGRSCKDVAAITVSITIFFVATPDLSSIRYIASMPAGVAAPPSPSTFDATFRVIKSTAFSLSFLKSRRVSGRKSFVSFLSIPVFSISFSTDVHTA